MDDVSAYKMNVYGIYVAKDGMIGWQWTTDDNIDQRQYYSFSINTERDGYNINSLELHIQHGGVDKWELRSSDDNYQTAISILTINESGKYNLDMHNFKVNGHVTFRLYGYDNMSLNESAGLFDNMIMYGNRSSIPEPATITLIMICGIAMYASKRWIV